MPRPAKKHTSRKKVHAAHKRTVHHSEKMNLTEAVRDTLVTYAKTQLLLIAVVSALTWIVLAYLRVQYPVGLALLTGALSVVPVFGITTAAIIAALVAVADNSRFLPQFPEIIEGLVMVLIYGALNMLVDYLLSPFMVGKRVKLHPALLLLLVIVGAWLFGLVGAFFAVPVFLVARTIVRYTGAK